MSSKYDDILKKRSKKLVSSLEKRENNINNIVNGFLTNPQKSTKYWNGVRSDLNKEYLAVNKIYSEWSKVNYPAFYDGVIKEQMKKANDLKNLTSTAKLSAVDLANTDMANQTKNIIVNSAIADMATGLALGKRDVFRLTRITQQTLISEGLIDKTIAEAYISGNLSINKTLKKSGTLANNLLNASEEGKYITIIDKNGNPRRYRITTYAELVTRTKWHEAQSRATMQTAANYGTDLVRVSNHNTTTEICQAYEGKIFSISGKSNQFASLDQAPPFHPNCLHYLTITFEETLKVSNTLQGQSDFSLGKTNRPPNQPFFIPNERRNNIVNRTIRDTRQTDIYKQSTPKQRKKLVSDKINSNLRKEALNQNAA
jgi:hypothetical protein